MLRQMAVKFVEYMWMTEMNWMVIGKLGMSHCDLAKMVETAKPIYVC